MFNCIYKYIFPIFILLYGILRCEGTPLSPTSQPITSPLYAKPGDRTISEEFLIHSQLNPSKISSISWLDNDSIIYSLDDQIKLFDIKNNSHSHLGKGSNPQVSPNGQWIAFIADHDDGNQIWLMKKDGSEKRQLTHIKEGLKGNFGYYYDFVWAHQSDRLAVFINPVEPTDAPKSWDSRANLPASQIEIVDLTGHARTVYSDVALFQDLSWYPNDEKLLMTKLCFNKDDATSYVQSLNLLDGNVSILAKFNGLQQSLSLELSPDGLHVALLYNAESDLYDWMPSVGIIASQKTDHTIPSIKQLTFDMKFSRVKWSKDGKSLFALRKYGAYDQIYTIDIKSNEIKQITNAPLKIYNFWVSRDGSKLIWRGMDAHGSSILRQASSHGSNVQDLIVEVGYESNTALSEVREIEWNTVNYPSKMRGLLFLPLHYKEGKKYPLIIDIHGGDCGATIYLAGGILTSNPLEWQLWTAKGYAVFVPEFRSSAAFGYLAILRDHLQESDIINQDIIDIMAGVDELVKQGIVDNDRVAVIGHSAGGRRANWLTVSTKRFRVVVSNEGWADEWALGMKTPVSWKKFGGSPLEVPEKYLRNSALFHSEDASTPTLFLMGNPSLGGIDEENTVRQLYDALKRQGVQTEYIEYLDEGHNFILPKNRRDALRRTIEWIDRYTQ